MKSIASIFLVLLFIFSCKKKEDVSPGPVAVSDVYEMNDPENLKYCPVMENDIFPGKATVYCRPLILPFGVFQAEESDIVFYPRPNAYGSFHCNYTLYATNGSASARVTVKRGTEAQIKTGTIISEFTNQYYSPTVNQICYLYAVDGDTSYFYHATEAESIRFDYTREIASYSSLIPSIPHYDESYYELNQANYSIDTDGIIQTTDRDGEALSLKIVDRFAATAKTYAPSGTVNVKGFTIEYEGKRYDYITNYPH